MTTVKDTDLRIGNWIYNGIGEEFQANGYTISEFFLGQATLGKFNPIPLTEEWLKRLGFEHEPNDANGGLYIKHISRLSPRFALTALDLSGGGETIFQWSIGESKYNTEVLPCKITYVHQLQNLYHALTGSELKKTK